MSCHELFKTVLNPVSYGFIIAVLPTVDRQTPGRLSCVEQSMQQSGHGARATRTALNKDVVDNNENI